MGVTPNPLYVDNLILSSNTNSTTGFNPIGLNNILSDALSLSQATSQTVTSALILSSTLGVTGATTLSSTLGVSGNTILTTLTLSGAASGTSLTLSSTLGVTGNTILTTLTLSGAASGTSLTLSSTLGVTGTLTTSAAQVAHVAIITASGTYAIAATDRYVMINQTTGAPIIVTMPTSPTTGRLITVKDAKGDAGTGNTITITASQNIDGIAGTTGMQINNAYGSIDFVFNGSTWNIL